MYKSILILLLLTLLTGCTSSTPDKETLLKIDNYSMSVDDFVNEVQETSDYYFTEKTKEQLLEGIIQKKLLLLEAQREGLDKDEPFMRMVEHFWEQSLLRAITEKKIGEFMRSVSSTDEDIKREEVHKKFDEWMDSVRKKARIYINKEALGKITIPGKK